MNVVELPDDLREWAAGLLAESWGAVESVSRGRVHRADELPALVALRGGEPVGLATYRVEGEECELVTINSLAPGGGTALLQGVDRAGPGRRLPAAVADHDQRQRRRVALLPAAGVSPARAAPRARWRTHAS